MFCENCGTKIIEGHRFCTKCGRLTSSATSIKSSVNLDLDQKWWMRLAKVIYIVLYIPLPFILWGVWESNNSTSSYNYFTKSYTYTDTSGDAFWYSLLTLLIYLVIIRLIKITFLYIGFGEKANWRGEFKKFL